MSRTQKLWGGILLLLLIISLIANVILMLWANQKASLAERRLNRIESLEQELEDIRIELERLQGEARLEDTMDTISVQTVSVRGLETLSPVTRRLVTQPQMGAVVLDKMAEEVSDEDLRQDTLLLQRLGLIPPDLDLRHLLNAMLEEQVAGLYDPATETFYVMSSRGKLGPLAKTIYAHEYTHALQDQHFDLEALGVSDDEALNDDQLLALHALIEGDATLTMQQYMFAHLSPLEMVGLLGAAIGVDQSVVNEAPPYLRKSLLFPYQEGLIFTSGLYQQGGWPAIDAAFGQPPQSSEQILHPERYPADTPQDVFLPDIATVLAPEWQLVTENVLGEFILRLYLDTYLTQQKATQAATGWGGDRYALYHNPTTAESLLLLMIAWDNEAEQAEFAALYQAYAVAYFAGQVVPVRDRVSKNRQWWLSETDTWLLAQHRASPATLLILAADRATADTILDQMPDF